MENIISTINSWIWSYPLIVLCGISGIYFSFRTGFLQFRYIKSMLKLLLGGKKSKKGISPFQAFSLAISGRVGTGNIVGVAAAIAMGGPGAVFWMWMIAILGAASAFVEATLGQLYKREVNGEYRGGPAYYIEKGLGIKWYAILFAIVTIISCGLLLPGVQSNSISSAFSNAFGTPTLEILDFPINFVGIMIILFLSLIIFGGVKRLGKVSEIMVSTMAGSYLIMACVIILMHIDHFFDILQLIFQSALNLNATYSGILGSAIAWGVKRGIYSNEAGQGTAPHAAAASEVSHPVEQGLVQAFSVYVDTLFVCTATAFVILFTGKYNVINEKNNSFVTENIKDIDYTAFTQQAISSHFPNFGNEFVAIALFFFAFTTIMAYYYYAETNITYIFGKKNTKKYIWILRFSFLIATYVGTIREAKLAWAIGDIGVGMMAWVNIIAILMMGNIAIKIWKDYENKKKKGIEKPTFYSKDINIKNADFWNKK